MTAVRLRASASRSARYASRVSRLTRQTPFLPILRAGRSPERMSVYTWVTVTLRTPATSAGLSSGGGRASVMATLATKASEIGGLPLDTASRVPLRSLDLGRMP